jgi:hypothetical protein
VGHLKGCPGALHTWPRLRPQPLETIRPTLFFGQQNIQNNETLVELPKFAREINFRVSRMELSAALAEAE